MSQKNESSAPDTRILSTASELMSLPGPDAERLLNSMPFEAQLACILQVPWKDRMSMIMQSLHARELVQAMPAEEIFWMIMERGIGDSLPVISRTTHEQFQYLIDIDCWKRDQLQPDNYLSWYKMLGRCNIAKVLEWFQQADVSLLVAGLKQFMHVYKIEEESDISEEYDEMPPSTIDGTHFFRFETDDAQQVLMPLLNVLQNHNPAGYRSLVEGLVWDSRLEAEEEALHWRQSRTAENGFPLFEEASGIYQPMTPEEQKGLHAEQNESLQPKTPSQSLQLRFALTEGKLPAFLQDVLQALSGEQLEQFEQVCITTANKIMIADGLEVRDLSDVRRALHKAAGFISIGLEHLSQQNIAAAQALLVTQHPELLFRCGHTLVYRQAERIRNHTGVIWTAQSRFSSFYGTPLADTALGFSRNRPVFYEGLLDQRSTVYRDFESLSDIEAGAEAIDRLIAADRLLFSYAGLNPEEMDAHYIKNAAINDPAELSMHSVMATLLIARSLDDEASIPLLDAGNLEAFADAVRKSSPTLAEGLQSFARQSVAWIDTELAQGAIEQKVLENLVLDCLSPVQEVLEAGAEPGNDLRYISAVLLRRR